MIWGRAFLSCALALVSLSAAFAQFDSIAVDTETIGETEIEVQAEFQHFDYAGGPLLLTVEWNVLSGAAVCEGLVLRDQGFTPVAPGDFADGTLENAACGDDVVGAGGTGTATAELTFTQLHQDEQLGTGVGTAHLFLLLLVDEDGDGEPETQAKVGVNVHVRGVVIAECAVALERLVSCDGGETFSESCVGANAAEGTPAQPVYVKYTVSNIGVLPFESCQLTDSNTGILPGETLGAFNLGDNLPLPGGDPVEVFAGAPACSDDLDAAEPSTATVNCLCVTPETVEEDEPLEASATASADFECETPGLEVTTECLPQAEMSSDVAVTVSNQTETPLFGCQATAEIAEGADCPVEPGQGTPVTLTPSAAFDLAAGQSVELSGMTLGLESSACHTVQVTCNLAEGGTITSTADDVCETPGAGCFRAGPGWWMNHPAEASELLSPAMGGEPDSDDAGLGACGLTWTTEEELYEDLCSNGVDAKSANTSPQQLKLIQKCAVVKLNLAATEAAGGNCEAANPQITEMIDYCCEEVCTGELTGQEIGQSGCLGLLGAFNSSLQGGGKLKNEPFAVAMADPSSCQSARGNGHVNDRPLGQPNGSDKEVMANGKASRFRSNFARGKRNQDDSEDPDGSPGGPPDGNGKGKPDDKGRPDSPGNSGGKGKGNKKD